MIPRIKSCTPESNSTAAIREAQPAGGDEKQRLANRHRHSDRAERAQGKASYRTDPQRHYRKIAEHVHP